MNYLNSRGRSMAKIPFQVSARTARLIGRENIASSKGAIVELVKNAYDADSSVSLIYFNKEKDELFIIDAGEGMTEQIIINHWMTIGTDNKAYDIFTKTGRVRAGEKGIGRFALDKLGDRCEMTTKFNPKIHKDIDQYGNLTNNIAYLWDVNWKDFEGDYKTIDEVEANLIGIEELDLKEYILKQINDNAVKEVIKTFLFEHGTVLKISKLRDNWADFYIEQVFNDLEVLVPPRENSSFRLFLFSQNEKNKYGEIIGSVCDDYDYKVVAKADENQKVEIAIYRNEYDTETINPDFFKRAFAQQYPYRRVDFQNKTWTTHRTFAELLPGFKELDKEFIFNRIGQFEFTFYFMKRTYSTPDLEKFHYNKFNARDRQYWLNKFGGLKLFRDDFRVRPYGEIKDSAFDWLGLGGRKSKNPAPTSHPSGRWKTETDNVAGSIIISRIGNIDFEDKSSREGLQENKTFQIFKRLLLEVIQVFETDRAKIAREMLLYYKDIHKDSIDDKDVDKIVTDTLNSTDNQDVEKIALAKNNQAKSEQIKQLEDEQKILRGMATSGIVTASFTHELGNLSDVLSSRVDELTELLEKKAPKSIYKDTPPFLNPYILIEDMKKQDTKLQSWLKFSLESAKKDKRKRKKILLYDYFNNFQQTWQNIFANRMINFTYSLDEQDLDMRALEIDLDSIFNNLLVNSIDSFMRQKNNINRAIQLKIYGTLQNIIVDYVDNGEGLSKDIIEHYQIFKALYTTKRNEHTGEEVGTGLGMWLVDTIVREYAGHIKLLYPENNGFGIRILFIRKYIGK